jgi:hypothetical protein
MTQPPDEGRKEQRLLRHARREGLLIMAVWALALVWTIASAYVLGYERPASAIRLVLGMPDWIFWSVVLPWGVCGLFSTWFCFRYMADDDLGQDQDEEGGHA